ncbi:MAG: pirin family protein [Sulfuricurvum sp.]|jgi:redox-sensitive bicupin YhaK (pirin superfamily)|uniref:pirin family protein n=1 Tax=Sulfuricurvum sp. TaxID=2025608 RepID=UPI0025E45A0A|nr:pirin family protein [Sulfuricurvum sp.]MCK9372424.1 pirin family protein [Sulfuricurvum sp.]
MLVHKTKSQQQIQYLFDNKFVENKPIPFPDYNNRYAYSNLFYWAHLEAYETAEFPLHPHKGFEIMTFVLKGSIEHFDTATNVWTPIGEGGFQVTQTGEGVYHSERIRKGSELFQIWFDPDFSKSLKVPASYQDYSQKDVTTIKAEGITIQEYVGLNNGIPHQTDNITITREFFERGNHTRAADESLIYSIYVINGNGMINQQAIAKDDFVLIDDASTIVVNADEELELFIIVSPKNLSYPRVRV